MSSILNILLKVNSKCEKNIINIKNKMEKKEEQSEKKDYIPPRIEVYMVEMEQGIAAGSAAGKPDIDEETNEGGETVDPDWNPW
ncbi:hypothetical protein CMU25_17380 [Elizabethkingia anophelis]|nr:hypothetical protein [Elizabethkingia anophelis]MDV3842095.1 hypothetical protein [Elizabethkingia anophelis]